MMQIDNLQKLGKDNMDAAVKSFGVIQKGAQTVAAETADFAKRSFETGTATMQKLAGVRTLDKAVEIQTEFAKANYEGLVAQATKMGQIYSSIAKEAFEPIQAMMPKQAAA